MNMSNTLRTRGGPFTGSLYRPGLPPGLYEEQVPRVRSQLVRLDTAAFIGLAERGPVNTPVLVGSMPDFRTIFGRAVPGMLLPQAVGAYFANGGRQCVVVRCLDHLKARTAVLALPGLTPAVPLVARSPGAWANRLKLRVRLKQRALPLRLAAAGDPDWPAGALLAPAHRARMGVTLRLLGTPAPLTTTARIVGVSTTRRGVASIVLNPPLASPYDAPALLLSAQEIRVGLDVLLGEERVETWDDATLDPAHPDFLPRLLGRRAASELLLAPRVTGEAEPDLEWGEDGDPLGSDFLRPGLSAGNTMLGIAPELIAAPDGLIFDAAELTDPASGSDANLTTDRAHFFTDTPGEPLNALHPFSGRPKAVDTLAVWDEKNIANPVATICMPDLLHPVEPAAAPDAVVPDDAPCFGVCVHTPLSNAAAALDYPLLGASLDDLRDYQIQLVDACDAHGGRIALLDLPPGLRAGDIVTWRRAMASGRAALFAPWLRAAAVDDPLGAAIELPPSAAAAGLIARVERQIGVHASPGNQTILGVFGIAGDPGLPQPGFLHEERIDAIRLTEKGIQLMGSRTTALDTDWTHINVRRILDWLMAQLPLDLAWAPFEPNNPRLWSAMTRAADRRLQGLFDAGALAGNTAAQSWFTRCDRTTMTQSDLDNGRVIMLVGVAPAVPMEFLVFRLMREGGDTVAEAFA